MEPSTPPRAEKRPTNHLLEESILPTWLTQRPVSLWGFIWIWIGLAVVIVTFQYGANGVEGGFTLPVVMLIVLTATMTLSVIMTMTADIGTEHGLSFAVFLRAPFGVLGTHFPSVSRGIVAACWFGIQTYLGALAINGLVEYWTGFSSWPLWYAVFLIVQVVNVALGIKAVEKLASIAAPCILAISIWMYFTLDGIAELEGRNIWTFAGDGDMSLVALFLINMVVWAPLAVDIPNITRFVTTVPGERRFLRRNRAILVAQFFVLPVMQAWIAFIGAVSFIVTGVWNPIEVIQGESTGLVLAVLLVMIILAQWSTNTAANVVPAALNFVNAAAPHLSYRMGVVLAGVAGTAVMPWLLLENLFTFLSYYGGFIAAIAGIMIADYYVLRHRRLNVPHLYRGDGQYRYTRGVNPAALIAWFTASVFALWQVDYAYVIGFPVAFVMYLVLMKTWILPRYPQAEIDTGHSDDFLATSVGRNWVYDSESRAFLRVPVEELTGYQTGRTDI
ncbi:NCS1 family nucleobase:cation symporter-1 [Lipingzhangella halophila]|uniref:NCS1 family nucleobase:cation symporter-1 n=1 Tax=Lipingzhangella halophila TaxID=1783352 RepID=A0A7W7RK92_9ACTN|nr:NCS1 family transporter [Lipingzhangella halophila]MBB4933519.1 NCS1 family nucleobase:cation symporter-1 [Lipingzhangella halophila]